MVTTTRLPFYNRLPQTVIIMLLLLGLIGMGLLLYLQPPQTVTHYTVNPHAYGRKTGTHAQDEVEVRLRVGQVIEWWYNPQKPGGNELFVGLAEPIPGGPTWLVFFNGSRNIVMDCYFQSNSLVAHEFIQRKGYTVPIMASPIP